MPARRMVAPGGGAGGAARGRSPTPRSAPGAPPVTPRSSPPSTNWASGSWGSSPRSSFSGGSCWSGGARGSPGAPRGDAFLGRGPARVEGTPRPVDVDHDRGMVRGERLTLARLAVDVAPDHAVREWRRHQEVVDAHADVLVEVAGAVVPPAVAPRLGVLPAID